MTTPMGGVVFGVVTVGGVVTSIQSSGSVGRLDDECCIAWITCETGTRLSWVVLHTGNGVGIHPLDVSTVLVYSIQFQIHGKYDEVHKKPYLE